MTQTIVKYSPKVAHLSKRKRIGSHVYLTATENWYHLKRFPGTKHVYRVILYHLKRFLGTKCRNVNAWCNIKSFCGTVYDEKGCGLQISEHTHSHYTQDFSPDPKKTSECAL